MSKDTTLQIAATHYESLRGYLSSHIQKLMRESGQSLNRRASAREKLTRLTKQQFQELSTDVYDEMIRRTHNSNNFPFLPVRDDFHPKRNQARQKLATLPSNRFKDLASDIYYEIERRFPSVTKKINERMGIGNENYSSPQQQPQQPYQDRMDRMNRMDMNGPKYQGKSNDYPRDRSRDKDRDRSRDVRDRDNRDRIRDRDYERDRENDYPQRKESQTKDQKGDENSPAINISSLDNLMADIGNMLTSPKSQNNNESRDTDNNELIAKLKIEHENEVNEMQKEIDCLKTEMQDLKASLEEKSNALEVCEEKVKKLQTDYDDIKKECEDVNEEKDRIKKDYDLLVQKHQELQDDFENREQMTNDIRQEATNLLEEIKVLSQKNEELLAEKEKNEEIIEKLRNGQEINNINERKDKKEDKEKDSKASPYSSKGISDETKEELSNGIISRDRIEAYEDSISHLLESTKSDVSTDVLIAMKSIVISCKTITEDIEKFENSSSMRSDQREQLDTLKNYLSAALTTLMTAAKSYATSYGKTPVSNLEEASDALTETVMDLVKFAKRSKSNDQSPSRKDNYSKRIDAKTITQLKEYIEGNTNKIVSSIQTLLYTLRQSNSFDEDFSEAIHEITTIVDEIINNSHDTLDNLSSSEYKPNIEKILLDLTNSNSKLDELGQKMIISPQSKAIKQQLASASYDIANYVKTLINELDSK